MRLVSEQFASLYGLSAQEISERCKVDLSTARRYKRGATGIPYAVVALLERDLGAFDPEWRGWKLAQGKLVSPEALVATPGDVRAIPFEQRIIAGLREDVRQLREALANEKGPVCDDQPLPDAWDLSPLRLVAV